MNMVMLRVESYRQKVEGADMRVGPHFGARRCVQDMLCRCWSHCLEASWNVKAHAQKPDFLFPRNRRVHLNRRGTSVQSTTGSRRVRISGSNAGYTMFRGSVKGTGYPLHSPVSPSLPLPCVTVCHHISTRLYRCENLKCHSRSCSLFSC